MPSSVNDFSLRTKKMSPDIGLASNLTDEPDVALFKGNFYKRSVTINNTGRTVKSNYVVAFILNTETIHRNNECAWTFSDLRVYDTDEVTELSFWVESPNTDYTMIFVKIPSLAASTRTIWLYYGNPALKNKASLANTCGSLFTSSGLKAWMSANVCERVIGGSRNDNTGLYFLTNRAVRQNPSRQTNPSIQPVFRKNRVNGLPAFEFDNNTDNSFFHTLPITNVQNCSVFTVIKPVSNSTAGAVLKIGGSNGIGIGVGSTTFDPGTPDNTLLGLFETIRWIVTGFSIGTGYSLIGMQISSGTPTMYHNATTVGTYPGVAPINATTEATISGTGVRQFDGDICEVFVFDSNLSLADRNTLLAYINAKYRLYSTADIPAITVNSQTTVTPVNFSNISYAPFSQFNTKSDLENDFYGIAPVESKATIDNIQTKIIAVGNDVENWSISDLASESGLSTSLGRSTTASNVNNIDEVTIERLDGSNNRSDLGKFEYANLIEPLTVYVSTDSDWIEFDFMCQNATLIDLVNSYIRFENSGNTLSYQSSLQNNINTLSSNNLNVVKIKKSAFTKTGSGTWSDASFRMKVNIRTTSGSQIVKYGHFKLVKNWAEDNTTLSINPVQLRNCVSSDNDTTYYSQVVTQGRVRSKLISSNDVEVSIWDYLNLIKDKTFSQFDSFPSGFVAYFGDDAGVGFAAKRIFHTYFLQKVLGFIFPKTYLDINLDFLVSTDTVALFGSLILVDPSIPNLNYFVIYATDKVGDVIEKLLNPTFGYLTYDQVSNKLVARGGYYSLFDFGGTLPVPVDQTWVYDYKSETQDDDYIYNYINVQLYRDIQEFGTLLGFADGSYELQPSRKTTIFFDLDDLITRTGASDVYPLSNLSIGGWNVSTALESNVYNNAGVSVSSYGSIGKQIYIEFDNANASSRYLKTLSMQGDYIKFIKNNTFFSILENVQPGELFDFEIKDQTSINKFGLRKYEIDNQYSYIGIDSSSLVKIPQLYLQFIEKFKNAALLTQVEVQYQPENRVGQLVKIRDKSGRLITGHVLKCETYSESGEYTNVITVREIR